MRTQIKRNQIADKNLTGASFAPELSFYDETRSYTTGDIVIFGGNIYKATADIPATTEGNLTFSPSNNDNWIQIHTIRTIENSYDANSSISIPKNNEVQFAFVYLKHPPEYNTDISPIPLTSSAWNNYEFFVEINNYLKLKESVKYYTTYENNLYHKFRLFSNDYLNIYDIDSVDN